MRILVNPADKFTTRTLELLKTIVETTDDITFSKDLDRRYTLMNSAAQRFLEVSKEEALGKTDNELLPRHTASRISKKEDQILKSNKPMRFEETLKIAGEERFFKTVKAPFQDDDGNVVGLICISRDITEQKLQERLKEVHTRLQTVLGNLPIILFAIDKHGIITLLEGKGLEALGKRWGENVGESIFEVFHDNQLLLDSFRCALAGEHIVATLGADRVFEAWLSPIFDAKGLVSGVIAAATDITKRKRMEEALQKSKESLAEAQKIAGIGDWVTDLSTDRVYGSDEAWHLYGLPPQEQGMLKDKLLDFVHPDDRNWVRQARDEAVDQKNSWSVEYRVILPGGEERIFHNRGSVALNEAGRPKNTHGTVQDITERKRTERAIQKKDQEIRKAYADVFSAVTAEKLVLLTEEEIDDALGEPISAPFLVCCFEDLANSRDRLREILRRASISEETLGELIMASGEAVTNGVKHAGSCEIRVYKRDATCQIITSDRGPGIDFSTLPKATLLSGFSTKGSLGLGFTVILDVFDRVLLATGRKGTTLILEINGQEPAGLLGNISAA